MSSETSAPLSPVSPASAYRVSLSPYVNERFPNWEELLSARDVARLTRRPLWLLLSLTFLGRFPRKHRFHGRGVGWRRTEVLRWLVDDLAVTRCNAKPPGNRPENARQTSLPLEYTGACSARRSRVPCSSDAVSRQ
jgi:predicted DNA-binding transcriptional regulator AlpA